MSTIVEILDTSNVPDQTYSNQNVPGKSLTNISGYNANQYYVFPNNIGQSYMGHWIQINIKVPIGTGASAPSQIPAIGTSAAIPITLTNNTTTGSNLPSPLTYTQIAQTIILAMPQNNLIHTSRNNYENIAMTYIGAQGIAALASGAAGAFLGAAAGAGLYSITNAIGSALGQASTLAGHPINPKLEILFSGREQRQFVFELLMSPTNKTEAETITNIIKILRFLGSPSLSGNTGLGQYFFIPPAQFDISFWYNGKVNTNVPRIKTCALEVIETDFAPTGSYSTFSTGHPVQTRLSLGFREIEIITQEDVGEGY